MQRPNYIALSINYRFQKNKVCGEKATQRKIGKAKTAKNAEKQAGKALNTDKNQPNFGVLNRMNPLEQLKKTLQSRGFAYSYSRRPKFPGGDALGRQIHYHRFSIPIAELEGGRYALKAYGRQLKRGAPMQKNDLPAIFQRHLVEQEAIIVPLFQEAAKDQVRLHDSDLLFEKGVAKLRFTLSIHE